MISSHFEMIDEFEYGIIACSNILQVRGNSFCSISDFEFSTAKFSTTLRLLCALHSDL